MSTKRKAGPKLTEKENPIRLIVPGVYQLRNGRKVTLKKHEGRWVAGHCDSGGFWHNDGCNSIRSDFDAMKLILPPDEPKPAHPKPIITSIGNYDTVGGDRFVEITWFEPEVNERFPWRGVVKFKKNRQLTACNYRWNNEGKCREHESLDITGKLLVLEPVSEPVSYTNQKPIITGPGEYATKDGSRKVIVEFKSQCPGEKFPWRGYVKILGSFELESWDDFGRPRSHHGTFPESRFIAGPWVEKKKFLVPCINVNDWHLEVFCLSANDAKEASKFVADNHPESCVGNAMTADELNEYIAAAIRPAIEGVEK